MGDPSPYPRRRPSAPMRRTKILATVGPATSSLGSIRGLVRAGANALRLNCSHGSDEEHRILLARMKEGFRRERVEGATLVDVQGPKLRIGDLAPSPLELPTGGRWVLDDSRRPGTAARAPIEIPDFARAARRGDPILLGDGQVELRVASVGPHRIVADIVHGGRIASHAGIYLPRAHLTPSVLRPKDRHDIAVAAEIGFDFLGLSFVRDGNDIRDARRELDRRAGARETRIIAKIERAEALAAIDDILAEADGIMVARGDLGIEVPLERLAIEQKELLRRARGAGKIGIVATQMLLSMVHEPRPTRAEATDVANAVLDGADAVMLSEESAIGDYPQEAVRWLDRLCAAAEPSIDPTNPPTGPRLAQSTDESIARASVALAERIGAAAIFTPTHSGRTARLVVRSRPTTPVVALSSSAATRRHLALTWGIEAEPVPQRGNLDHLERWAREVAHRRGWTDRPLVLTAGYPVEGRPTNLVTVIDTARPPGRLPRSRLRARPRPRTADP